MLDVLENVTIASLFMLKTLDLQYTHTSYIKVLEKPWKHDTMRTIYKNELKILAIPPFLFVVFQYCIDSTFEINWKDSVNIGTALKTMKLEIYFLLLIVKSSKLFLHFQNSFVSIHFRFQFKMLGWSLFHSPLRDEADRLLQSQQSEDKRIGNILWRLDRLSWLWVGLF